MNNHTIEEWTILEGSLLYLTILKLLILISIFHIYMSVGPRDFSTAFFQAITPSELSKVQTQRKFLFIDGNIGYDILKDEDKEGCFAYIKWYNDHEVLAKTIQMKEQDRQQQWEQFWPSLVKGGFSTVAIDITTNKIIGAHFIADMHDLKPAYNNPNEWNSSPVHQLQLQLEIHLPKEIIDQPRGKVLNGETVWVDYRYSGRKITEKLGNVSYVTAMNLGYRYWYGWTTNPITYRMNILSKQLYKIYSIQYKDFVYRGKKVFENVDKVWKSMEQNKNIYECKEASLFRTKLLPDARL